MNLNEIDQLLEAWRHRLGAAAQNLMDLQAEPVYQRLAGDNGVPKADLTGLSAATVQPALDAMGTLFQHFNLLQQTIDDAAKLRRDMPALFGIEQQGREIQQLLLGKSIHLPPVDVPLEQRTLLSAVANVECISPDDLLNAMVGAFQASRDAVLTAGASWESAGAALDNAEKELNELQSRAADLKIREFGEIDAASTAIRTAAARLARDPIGTAAGITSTVRPLLDSLREQIDKRAAKRKRLDEAFTVARKGLAKLADVHERAVSSLADCREKVTTRNPLPVPETDQKLRALSEWLNRLEGMYFDFNLQPIEVGLKNLNQALDATVAGEERTLTLLRSPLELRSELRGRLDALKAKARSRNISEDADLQTIAQEAAGLLFARPTPIDRAFDLVVRYEAVLNAREIQRRQR